MRNGLPLHLQQNLQHTHQAPSIGTLVDLGIAMHEADTSGEGRFIKAGYTYLGQFIDHDMSKLSTSNTPVDANHGVENAVNHATPQLDLMSMYGTGFNDISAPVNTTTGHLRLSPILDSQGRIDHRRLYDLPRRADKTAIIPDPRNDAHLLLAQFHTLFMRFHNKVASILFPFTHNGEATYQQARAYVIESYKHIIVEDFLKTILHPQIWAFYFDKPASQLHCYWNKDTESGLPLAFNGAAFRFGHAMVKDAYFLNSQSDRVTLSDLFLFTGKNNLGGYHHLPEWLTVDWSMFFSPHAQQARTIKPSTIIEVPDKAWPNGQLAIVNLLRGRALNLPDAWTMIKEIKATLPNDIRPLLKAIPKDKIFDKGLTNFNHIPNKRDIIDSPPLWYYVLREVKALGKRKHLGPLASFIVGDTFAKLLKRGKWKGQHYPEQLQTPTKSITALLDLVGKD
ncbi:hypothetical protein OE749_16975 [Aestuariibacter sp. AA17]|uniref:Animal haem peroxidase n=1 Tax=Fluctibacter corallii TaxID=2984329 RepID=A0ABT3ACK1_9ALTE|nr:peroxidase family protein [Aestuariibacter sp. AA17]MCV2886390.1 hypothetical protein [Aestuariibacter sp. AA17]